MQNWGVSFKISVEVGWSKSHQIGALADGVFGQHPRAPLLVLLSQFQSVEMIFLDK